MIDIDQVQDVALGNKGLRIKTRWKTMALVFGLMDLLLTGGLIFLLKLFVF